VEYLVRSPRQASTVFGLDGNSAPRKKSSFYVRFCRADVGQTSSGWQDGLGFLVKSLDRPSVQPKIEEINQYNKKRQITTGFEIQPMKITLYDTSDSMVMRMWNEYSKWYFGDFNQADATSFGYDVTLPEMNGTDTGDFGFVPRPDSDLNSQFFFSHIEVYQVFGREFTQFDLINPKIKAFDPDELDYSDYEAATISLTIAYEAILYRNNGTPAPISSRADVSAVFDEDYNGDTFDVAGAPSRQVYQTTSGFDQFSDTDDYRLDRPMSVAGLSENSGNTLGSGSLRQFGNYDFGSLSPAVRLGGGTAGDVSYLAGSNIALASLLNLPTGSPIPSNPESKAFGTSSTSRPSISAASLDSTEGTLVGAGSNNDYADSYIKNNLVSSVAASAVIDGNSGRDQLTDDSTDGLALNSQSYGIINSRRPSYSQIGFNSNQSEQYSPNGIPAKPVTSTPFSLLG